MKESEEENLNEIEEIKGNENTETTDFSDDEMELAELSEGEENEVGGGSVNDGILRSYVEFNGLNDQKNIIYFGYDSIRNGISSIGNDNSKYFSVTVGAGRKALDFKLTRDGKNALKKGARISGWVYFSAWNNNNQYIQFKIKILWRNCG